MTFEQYWIALLKHWRLLILCFLAVGAGTYIGSKLITPQYQSSVIMQVAIRSQNGQADYTNLLASNQLVQTEATLTTSDPVLRDVVTRHPGLTVEQLAQQVTTAPKVNTQLFEIDVQAANPREAAALANDIAATLVRQQMQITQQNVLYIAQSAQPSQRPIKPNVSLNTSIGLLIGLLIGMVLAVVYEQLDTRVRTADELIRLLDWPLLATIWNVSNPKKEEIFNPQGSGANVEAYRLLRTNIGFSALDTPVQSLMVTSAVPQDGKSTVAANLAIFMAKAGKTTLLIDADLRRPIVHMLFGLSKNKPGLSNAVLAYSRAISGPTPSRQELFSVHAHKEMINVVPETPRIQETTVTTPTLETFVHAVGIPNLWVMPAGSLPPNPPELLDSKAMLHLLSVLEESGVEVVIFDTPPLLGLSDANILASKVDGVLIVVDIARADKKPLVQMKKLLTRSNTHVLGCVVNKQPRRRSDGIFYNYNSDEEQRDLMTGLMDSTENTDPITTTLATATPADPGTTVKLPRLSVVKSEAQENGKVEK